MARNHRLGWSIIALAIAGSLALAAHTAAAAECPGVVGGICPGGTGVTPPRIPAPTPTPTPSPTPTPNQSPTPLPSPSASPTPLPSPGAPGQPVPQPGIGVQGLSAWVEEGAAHIMSQVPSLITARSGGGTDWFAPYYQRMVNIEIVLLGLFLVLALIQGFLSNDPWMMVEAALIRVPVAIWVTAVATGLTGMLMSIVDDFSRYMAGGLSNNLSGLITHVTEAALAAAGGVAAGVATGGGAFVVFLALLVVAVAGALLALEFVLREAAIYIVLLFVPLVAAARVWPMAEHVFRRLIELLVGLILLKLVVVSILVLGAAAFAASPFDAGALPGDPQLVHILMGAVILVVAVLSPLALASLIPLGEHAAHQAFSGATRGHAFTATRKGRGFMTYFRRKLRGSSTAGRAGAAGAAGAAAGAAGAVALAAPGMITDRARQLGDRGRDDEPPAGRGTRKPPHRPQGPGDGSGPNTGNTAGGAQPSDSSGHQRPPSAPPAQPTSRPPEEWPPPPSNDTRPPDKEERS